MRARLHYGRIQRDPPRAPYGRYRRRCRSDHKRVCGVQLCDSASVRASSLRGWQTFCAAMVCSRACSRWRGRSIGLELLMRFRARRHWPIVLLLLSGACSWMVDTSNIDTAPCPNGQQACSDFCASPNDVRYGCGDANCNPCAFTDGGAGPAVFSCAQDANQHYFCKKTACLAGRDGSHCTIDLMTDPHHCGDMKVDCDGALCLNGVCDTGGKASGP